MVPPVDFDNLTIMIPSDVSGLSSLKKDEKFREAASELLLRSKDVVGDMFLINLPDILSNVQDLESLYGLVFDKVSIKDLTDLMMENIGKNMNIPDLNEIKIRGIMKAIKFEDLVKIIPDILDEQQVSSLLLTVLEELQISKDIIDNLLPYLEFLTANNAHGIKSFANYLLAYDSVGNLVGIYADVFEPIGDLKKLLEERGLDNEDKLKEAFNSGSFKFSEIFQMQAFTDLLKQMIENGIDNQATPTDIADGFFKFLKDGNKSQILQGIDNFMKSEFKNSDDLFEKLIKNKKIKTELDKINLTKKKFLNKVPGLELDLESKKIDANFSMPSIKSVNPSFDFSKFEFKNTGDIFGSAIGSIEQSIKSGIETGLVASFKGMLGGVLDSISNNTPNLDNPEFGALNMNDIFDATNGFGADKMASLVSKKLKFEIELNNSRVGSKCKDLQTPSEVPSDQSIRDMFDDMSKGLKPMELTRILKGQHNSKDYENMAGTIQNVELKNMLSEDTFIEILEIAENYVDLNLLKELEDAYSDKEVMISVCENSGIPYNHDVRKVKENLENKYPDLTDDEIDDLIDSIVDEVKDSMVDAIGNMKEDFQDNLPFDENPCSFMPKPSSIPAMDFIDDMTFDSIFDPIELEYKSEATTVPDVLLSAGESSQYVPLYYYQFDQVLDGFTVDENGLPEIVFKTASELDNWDDINDGFGRMYNEDFANHYYGRGTDLYELVSNEFKKFNSTQVPTIIQNDLGQWGLDINASSQTEKDFAESGQVYVKKRDQNLMPMPELKEYLQNPQFNIQWIPSSENLLFYLTFGNAEGGTLSDAKKTGRFKLALKKSSSSLEKITVDLENPNLACIERETHNISSAPQYQGNILETMNSYILDEFEEHYGDRGLSGLAIDLEKDLQKRINSTVSYYFNRYDHVGSRSRIKSNLDKTQNPISVQIYGSIFEQIMRLVSETNLFDTSNMLAFIIDNEDINLLKLQDAKNEAKDAYKDECSFVENDQQIQSTSIKKLIYLLIRMFVIEDVIRGCFVYDSFYELEASDEYCENIYENMKSEIKKYPNGFYASLFKPKYLESYGEDFENVTESFNPIVKEIYSDISKSFEELYSNAKASVVRAFIASCVSHIDNPSQETYISLPSQIKKSYIDYFSQSDTFAKKNLSKVKSRFIIQRSVQLATGNKETFYGDATPSDISQAHKQFFKLCFIMSPDDANLNIESFIPEVDIYYSGGGMANVITEQGFVNNIYPNGVETTQRNKRSTSHLIKITDLDGLTKRYYVIPVASLVLQRNSNIQNPEIIMDFLADSQQGIGEFLYGVVRLGAMKEFISSSIQSKMLLDKPEVSLMFNNTKTLIRRSIESLSKNDYDREETETNAIQLKQESEQSTNPDFSSKAAKMALMTVPMIIKGFAEMFDPNTKVASGIRKGFDLAGIDIPPPVASLMALPVNIIPLAPGPPITPLGLLYLATSFLEPKERKRLSDLKRGKNLNPAANQETGTFEAGTLEEQAAILAAEAIEGAQKVVDRYQKLMTITKLMCDFIVSEVDGLINFGAAKGKVQIPNRKELLDKKPVEGSTMEDYLVTYYILDFDQGVGWGHRVGASDHIRLDGVDGSDNADNEYNGTGWTGRIGASAAPWNKPSNSQYLYGNSTRASYDPDDDIFDEDTLKSRLLFIANHFQIQNTTSGFWCSPDGLLSRFNSYIDYGDVIKNSDDVKYSKICFNNNDYDIRKVIEKITKTQFRLYMTLFYTLYVINGLSREEETEPIVDNAGIQSMFDALPSQLDMRFNVDDFQDPMTLNEAKITAKFNSIKSLANDVFENKASTMNSAQWQNKILKFKSSIVLYFTNLEGKSFQNFFRERGTSLRSGSNLAFYDILNVNSNLWDHLGWSISEYDLPASLRKLFDDFVNAYAAIERLEDD